MSTSTTTCPVVRRKMETFHQPIHVGGELKIESFDRPILWVQESETQVVYLHGGKILLKGAEFSDYFGYLTSFVNREDYDKTVSASDYDITEQSSLEMQLVTRIMQIPMIETDSDREYNAKATHNGTRSRQYTRIPEEWRKEMPCEHSPSGKYYPTLEPVLIVEAVVWTSKRSAEDNQAFEKAFIEEWAVCSANPSQSSSK